eukprot:3385023-Lingulodinium_polyedra.AAC.1
MERGSARSRTFLASLPRFLRELPRLGLRLLQCALQHPCAQLDAALLPGDNVGVVRYCAGIG